MVEGLTKNVRRRRYINNLPELPTSLDEIEIATLPEGWVDRVSFSGFNKDGICAHFNAEHFSNKTITGFAVKIPGIGQFSYKNNVKRHKGRTNGHKSLYGNEKLQIFAQQPMKRWRIVFRGACQTSDGKHKHAALSLFWQCLADPFDYFSSPSCWDQANSLAQLSLKDIRDLVMSNTLWFQQWGELRGTINMDGHQELHIRLKTVRERIYSPSRAGHCQPLCSQHLVIKDSGQAFSINIQKLDNGKNGSGKNMLLGYMTFPIGDNHVAHPEKIRERKDEHGSMVYGFPQIINSCNLRYHIVEKMNHASFPVICDERKTFEYKTLLVDHKAAYGIQLFDSDVKYNSTEEENNADNINNTDDLPANDTIALCIGLDQPACKQRGLVGGKASQLSMLRTLKEFHVPKGFCMTVIALKKQIDANTTLGKVIEKIKSCVERLEIHKLKQLCDAAVHAFRETSIDEELSACIREQLDDTFGRDVWEKERFAVRSSGLGEDSYETSSAGQMETILGVQGFDNILEAVKQCWASAFSYQVVEYRRQNGQEMIDKMAIVIQAMVDADYAGVLFTTDPVTGDDTKMILNAALGLGESVVSGRVTPDTIVVKRNANKTLEIDSVSVGDKAISIIMKPESGVSSEDTSNTQRNQLCLKDDEIIKICSQGLYVESHMEAPQDIEWAISKGQLYILQARPITTHVEETDEEMIHEFDSPVVSDNMLITTANIQEMMPGAVSTLTNDLFVGAIERSLQNHSLKRIGINYSVHATAAAYTFSGIPLLNMTPSAVATMNSIGGEKSKTNVEIFVVGQTVKEHTLEMIRQYYGRSMPIIKRIYYICRQLFYSDRKSSKKFESFKLMADTFSVDGNSKTAKELYDSINDKRVLYYDMWLAYIFKAAESAKWSGIIMSILKGKSEEVTVENMADMALILSECKDIYSAEVPLAINTLARRIADSDVRNEFIDTPIEDCDPFLKNRASDEIKEEYVRFMERQGHRGIREAEFLEKSWALNPSELMKTLKLVIEQGSFEEKEKPKKTLEEIVESIKTPISSTKKWILKHFLIEKAMKGVGSRELGKSVCIKVSNAFKKAYWRLAALMVRESRLPEPDLLFFLTHAEIGDLLYSRSAKLIRLAKRRMKVYPVMQTIRFDKINIGLPRAVQDENKEMEKPAQLILHGMPVCRGTAKGTVCVIKSLGNAYQIKRGDILVCRYTDVGWSPYFPLIRGLVTELGGLLSHGAVVARECGIPCIVNTPGATDFVSSGDTVVIDGTAGTLTKLAGQE